jgi:hypothetical protein
MDGNCTGKLADMRLYPVLQSSDSRSTKDWIDFVSRERYNDVNFIKSLPNSYVGGRSVAKVPSGSTDNVGSAAGDLSASTKGVFIAVNSGSTVSWIKITSSTF